MIESPLLEDIAGYVGGRWVARGASGATLTVYNPATGDRLAAVPDLGAAETEAAIDAARVAFERGTRLEDRRRWLGQIADLLLQNKAEMARIITLEQGKPLKESLVEVEYSAGFFRFFSKVIDRLNPEPLPEPVRNLRWTIHHRPAGVVGLITPWNFPLAMMAKKLAPALAAGCGIVTKPADLTPLTAIAFWKLVERLELPAGLLNLVTGKPAPIGDVLCAHPAVRLISFTGSTAVGKLLMKNVAPYVKRLALELGGNAPYIVMDDADVVAAADALVANKFRCAGQTCVCANRIYVQRRAATAFTAAIAERVRKLRVGNGMEDGTDVGPLINPAAFDKVDRHVRDAMKHGATRVVGADRPRPTGEWGAFYNPTVLTGAGGDMALAREETFGPVVAIAEFESEDDAVRLANGTPYGLAAYLFTADRDRADALVARLRFGHVGVNTGSGPAPEAPFGGMKESGFGREGGVEGLMEFCETQTVVRP